MENEQKEYVFTREVKRWGVEAGDRYNPNHHQIVGGTEKLLAEGIIEEEDCQCDCHFISVTGCKCDCNK